MKDKPVEDKLLEAKAEYRAMKIDAANRSAENYARLVKDADDILVYMFRCLGFTMLILGVVFIAMVLSTG